MARRFRLLDLSEDCVKTVLQCFDYFDLISFSLCSKKRLANVRSLKLQIRLCLFCGITFYAQVDFGGNVMILRFCEEGYDREISLLNFQPRRLQVDYIEGENLHWQDGNQEPPIRRWRKANYRGNDWLRHFMFAFNCDEIESLAVMQSKFGIDSLMDTVQNLNISQAMIFRTVSKEHTLGLLNALPCLENLSVGAPSEYAALLRNQQKLTIQNEAKITLDIVLTVNSLAFNCSRLSIKDVNRFIKLWKKGANLRLKHLAIGFFANHVGAVVLNENEVLRGVQHRKMPQGTVRMFEMPGNRMEEIDGGFDIVGKNGRKATVILINPGMHSFFHMFVWH